MNDRFPPASADYEMWHANVIDGIRYATSGIQDAEDGAEEALAKLRGDNIDPILGPPRADEAALKAAMTAAIERGEADELDTDETAHRVLDAMRSHGVPLPNRPPDDPFPEL